MDNKQKEGNAAPFDCTVTPQENYFEV